MISLRQATRVIAYNAARRVVVPMGRHIALIPPGAAEVMEMYTRDPDEWRRHSSAYYGGDGVGGKSAPLKREIQNYGRGRLRRRGADGRLLAWEGDDE